MAILMVIAFHLLYPMTRYVEMDAFVAFVEATVPAALALQGHFGVDVFFVMSGFLVTSMYLKRTDNAKQLELRRYLSRRAIRLLPPYLAVMVVAYLLLPRHCPTIWTNLLLINNYFPADQVCVFWSWSLAIEFQFYLLLPYLCWLLARTPHQMLLAALLGGAVALNIGYLLQVGGFDSNWDFANRFYSPTQFRVGALLLGVAAAYVHRDHGERLRSWAARPGIARAWFTLALLMFLIPIGLPSKSVMQDFDSYTLLSSIYEGAYRYIFSGGVTLYMLLALSGGSPRLGKLLGHRVFIPIARLSYVVYLVHLLVIEELYALLFEDIADLLLIIPIALALIALVSYLTHVLVEAPFLGLKERRK